VVVTQELQLGRGFSAAEGSRSSEESQGEKQVQWGRGFSAAEGPPASRSAGRACSRFNGAAAFQPRKDNAVKGGEAGTALLQWGRGFSAAEGQMT